MPLAPVALASLALASLAAAPAQASTSRIDVPATAARVVHRINLSAPIPVLLPSTIVINGAHRKAYASGAAFRRGWVIELGYVPGCAGANACALASFSGEQGASLGGRANVTLPGGIKAHYKPLSCGGSCSPAQLTFVVGRAAYTFSVKDPAAPARSALISMANQAIHAGKRG